MGRNVMEVYEMMKQRLWSVDGVQFGPKTLTHEEGVYEIVVK